MFDSSRGTGADIGSVIASRRANLQRKKEDGLIEAITAFFTKNTQGNKSALSTLIASWMEFARLGLSLNHETYLQTLSALYKMFDHEAYQQHIINNDISVNLNEKRQLDGDAYLEAKLEKGYYNVLLFCFGKCCGEYFSGLGQGVNYDQTTYDLLITWQKIIKGANDLKYSTDDLKKLEIKGEEFMQSSGESRKLTP